MFGVFSVLVGLGMSYLMIRFPENLNPDWPLGAALIAASVFTLGGLHMIGSGLGKPRLSSGAILATVFCLVAVVNYAAYFTDHYQCRGSLSFLGLPVMRWYSTEEECRNSLRILMAGFDAFLLFVFGGAYWLKFRASRKQPG